MAKELGNDKVQDPGVDPDIEILDKLLGEISEELTRNARSKKPKPAAPATAVSPKLDTVQVGRKEEV